MTIPETYNPNDNIKSHLDLCSNSTWESIWTLKIMNQLKRVALQQSRSVDFPLEFFYCESFCMKQILTKIVNGSLSTLAEVENKRCEEALIQVLTSNLLGYLHILACVELRKELKTEMHHSIVTTCIDIADLMLNKFPHLLAAPTESSDNARCCSVFVVTDHSGADYYSVLSREYFKQNSSGISETSPNTD